MASLQENFMDWLRDAHAMEQQAMTMLNAQSQRLESYPDLKARIDQHITETSSQITALEGLFERLGESTSTIKDMTGKVMAAGQAFGGMFASDEVVKGAMAGYTFEQMEIAAYRILITTAEQLQDLPTAEVLNDILKQEVAMADWLQTHLPDVTRNFLMRDASDQTAKR